MNSALGSITHPGCPNPEQTAPQYRPLEPQVFPPVFWPLALGWLVGQEAAQRAVLGRAQTERWPRLNGAQVQAREWVRRRSARQQALRLPAFHAPEWHR